MESKQDSTTTKQTKNQPKPLPKEPRTNLGRRIQSARLPKTVENDKKTLLCGTVSANSMLQQFLLNLAQLKQPLVQRLHTAVENPINDSQYLEKLSLQTDASLFVHISHSKKRPDNVVFGRLYNYQILQQSEFQMTNFVALQDIQSSKPQLQCKPCLQFFGAGFDQVQELVEIKSLFIDLFKGKNFQKFSKDAVQYCINFYVDKSCQKILVRSYIINDLENQTYKQVTEPVHLTPMGFQFDLLRRRQFTNALLLSQAVTKEKKKQTKDGGKQLIQTDELGNQYATVHTSMAGTSRLNLRKFKGFKTQKSDKEDVPEQ